MSYRTLEEWNARGRQVIKGEKAMGRLNDNTPLFGKEQTQKTRKRRRPPVTFCGEAGPGTNWDQNLDWDECQELGLHIGLPGQW